MSQDVSFRSPEFFPFDLDVGSEAVSFIRLSREDYGRASFLDARILTSGTSSQAIPWGQVVAAIAAADLRERCSFIFHIGHVGSTLLSRLIGAHPDAFALREPLILRTLAVNPAELASHLEGVLKLLSRTFEARQLAVVKATSFVSEIATVVLARATAPRALFLYVSPETYLATILGGPNSRREGQRLTASRLRRLQRRVGHEVRHTDSLSEGEALAMGWACEMTALAHAATAAGNRGHWLDFDRFLSQPKAELMTVLRHLQLAASDDSVDAILQGPDMGRYSKAPEYAYDAALRRDVLNEARAAHREEILRGLRWLERAAVQTAAVRDALTYTSPLP